MPLDDLADIRLQRILKRHPGLSHLRVVRRGDSLSLVSGQGDEEQKHARLTSLGRNVWGLSLPRHTGRWERTPFVGPLDEIVDTLVRDLGFYLTR